MKKLTQNLFNKRRNELFTKINHKMSQQNEGNMMLVNDNNMIFIEDSEEEIEDQFDYSAYANNIPVGNQANQFNANQTRTLRLLNPNQLFHLSEGTFRYITRDDTLQAFRTFKFNISHWNDINLINHQDDPVDIELISTTPKKQKFSQHEVDVMIKHKLLELRYELYIKAYEYFPHSYNQHLLKIFDLSSSTASDILKRRSSNLPLVGNKPGRKPGTHIIVTTETIRLIKQFVDSNPTVTINQIFLKLLSESRVTGSNVVSLSESSITNLITKLGYSYKRVTKEPINRNSEMALKKRVVWGELFLSLVKCRTTFIYVDESGFNRGITRSYGRAPVGHPPNIVTEKTKNQNMTVIAALAVGFGVYHEVIVGPCNGDRFYHFCVNLLAWIIRTIPRTHQVVIVMDNASIHRKDIHKLFWDHHCFLLKTIPYSPQVNGIEYLFNQCKSFVRRIFGCSEDMERSVFSFLSHRVEEEYENRLNELYQIYLNNSNEMQEENEFELNNFQFSSNYNVYTQRVNDLNDEFDIRRNQIRQQAQNTHPTRDEIADDMFFSFIDDAFKSVSIEQSLHYHSRVIKVAHACSNGYPLTNDSRFYHNYMIPQNDPVYQYLMEFVGNN